MKKTLSKELSSVVNFIRNDKPDLSDNKSLLYSDFLAYKFKISEDLAIYAVGIYLAKKNNLQRE